jgi:hypothetical protein
LEQGFNGFSGSDSGLLQLSQFFVGVDSVFKPEELDWFSVEFVRSRDSYEYAFWNLITYRGFCSAENFRRPFAVLLIGLSLV